uniref:Hepcidin n=1 Tax=Panagrolaimus davidi TaxID=227884 RepID=A0A914PUL6_9BILA
MNSNLFFFLALFIVIGCVYAAAAFDNSMNETAVIDEDNFSSPNVGFLSRFKRANKKCRRFPGCVQFMCNRCCGNCNKADCVTGMCFLCCR